MYWVSGVYWVSASMLAGKRGIRDRRPAGGVRTRTRIRIHSWRGEGQEGMREGGHEGGHIYPAGCISTGEIGSKDPPAVWGEGGERVWIVHSGMRSRPPCKARPPFRHSLLWSHYPPPTRPSRCSTTTCHQWRTTIPPQPSLYSWTRTAISCLGSHGR